jgi:hypothetical protein
MEKGMAKWGDWGACKSIVYGCSWSRRGSKSIVVEVKEILLRSSGCNDHGFAGWVESWSCRSAWVEEESSFALVAVEFW